MRRTTLRNIAAGLAGSFASRNNDAGGYWAIGQLRSLADQRGVAMIQIALVPRTGSDHPLLAQLTDRWVAQLARLIQRAGGAVDAITEAKVVAHFAAAWPAGVARAGTSGDPVACEVHLVDRAGRHSMARRTTFCLPHDATRECRSARSGDA